MAYSSSTKSWQSCSKDQRRECMAFAAFTKLKGLPGETKFFVEAVRRKVLLEAKNLEDKEIESLTENERKMITLRSVFDNLSSDVGGLEKIEKVFGLIERVIVVSGFGGLSGGEIKTYIKSGELAKICRAVSSFIDGNKWSGGALKAPNGKSESAIGIPDSLLEKLLIASGGDGLLTSWLQSGDRQWKKAIDGEIERRKRELTVLKRNNSSDPRVRVLEWEIDKLNRDWKI